MPTEQQTHPNVLLITTDQQRADTIHALGTNPIIRTPSLDRLVREGTTFTRAYSPSPVCVPARFALATGLPAHVSGCTENPLMPEHGRSFMQMLAPAGYDTHGCGKMHFAPDPDGARLWGFGTRDFSEEVALGDDYHKHVCENGYAHVLDLHGVRGEYYYLPQPSQLPAHLHNSAWVVDRSIDFIKRRASERPFFLWTSFIKPHPPFENPSPWNRLYRSVDIPDPWRPENSDDFRCFWNAVQNRYKYMEGESNPHLLRTIKAAYYACISFLDQQIGRLLDALGPEIDNTVVIFTSDHGEMLGDHGCFGKRCMLEPSVRVPLIVRYPPAFRPGLRCGVPASLADVYPTLLAACGSPEPRPWAQGEDLARLANSQMERRAVISQFSQRSLGLYMITDGREKYVYSAADEKEWLFELGDDLREQIVASDRACTSPLKAELIHALAEAGGSDAVVENAWRKYGRSRIPASTRDGVLFQDPPELYQALDVLSGYGTPRKQTWPSILHLAGPRMMDQKSGITPLNENWPGNPAAIRVNP